MKRTLWLGRGAVVVGLLTLGLGCSPSAQAGGHEPPDKTPDAGTPVTDADEDSISDDDEGRRSHRDTDEDGVEDYLDLDSDGDGVGDIDEAGDSQLDTRPRDSDSDGLPDYVDRDSDGNGIDDSDELLSDTDGDFLPDIIDRDDDGDFVDDSIEVMGGADLDTDHDGVPNLRDPDSDGDTILDGSELTGDTDRDGIPDRLDTDSDDDGILDRDEAGDLDLTSPPVDTDGDFAPDFLDTDSDDDGLSDANEVASGTSPIRADTDLDGVSDLIEVAAGTDPADATISPRTRGDFVFVVPYMEDPAPTRDTLHFHTNIQLADVYFLMDTTASMDTEIGTMRNATANIVDELTCEDSGIACLTDSDCSTAQRCGLGGTCIESPAIAGCVPSIYTGVGRYEGSENSFRNLVSVQADAAVTRSLIPTSANGGGADESLFESVACVAEPTICTGARCSAGGIGCPAFRSDAIRILVAITDENDQCSCGFADSAAQAGMYLATAGIKFVGVSAEGGLTSAAGVDLIALARASGSVDSAGNPLVFAGDGAAVETAVTTAVRQIAQGVPLRATIGAEDRDDDAGDALQFIERFEINGSAHGCADVSPREDTDSDGFDDAFPAVLPGTDVCWDVVVHPNTTVEPLITPQVFRAVVTVHGNDSPLDSREVYFLVPPHVDPPGGPS